MNAIADIRLLERSLTERVDAEPKESRTSSDELRSPPAGIGMAGRELAEGARTTP